MVSCQVRTGFLPTVKLNAPNERVYQLSHADQRNYCTGFKVLRYIYNPKTAANPTLSHY